MPMPPERHDRDAPLRAPLPAPHDRVDLTRDTGARVRRYNPILLFPFNNRPALSFRAEGRRELRPAMNARKQRPVLTVYNGRCWVNVVEGVGPLRGSFPSRDAAAIVGRAHAADAKTIHVIHDESGLVVERKSYERLADFRQLFDSPVQGSDGVGNSGDGESAADQFAHLGS